ncbi:hypothetical protein Tco_0035386 [Tanacetum coccineum]
MDIGGSSYDVSGNVIVKRQCIQQPDFRQETLGQIGSIEHQQRSTREVDPVKSDIVAILPNDPEHRDDDDK